MTIRKIEHQDAEEIFACVDRNRTYLRRWLPWLDETTETKHVEGFIRSVLLGEAEKKQATFVILDEERIVGVCGYNWLEWKRKAGGIGYWLSEDRQGRGIMTHAISELTDYGFHRLGLELCEICAATGNSPSRALAERLGYVCTGTIRRAENLYGVVVDYAIYSVLKEEWMQRRKQD